MIKQQAGKKVVVMKTRTSESKSDFKVFLWHLFIKDVIQHFMCEKCISDSPGQLFRNDMREYTFLYSVK